MDKLNSEMKNYNIKIGKSQMSKTQYLELIKKHHKSLDIKNNNDNILTNSINLIKNNNEKKINNIILSQNQKDNQINNNKKIIVNESQNLGKKILKENKEINLLTIEAETKKEKKNLKQTPIKKQIPKTIYKQLRNPSTLENINFINETPKEKINNEFLMNTRNKLNLEKDHITSSTSQITNPDIINDSFENLETLIINGDNNRKTKYFVKKEKKTLNNSSIKYFNIFDFDLNNNNKKYYSNRNYNNDNYFNKNFQTHNTFNTIGSYNVNNFNINSFDLSLNVEDLIMIENKFSKLLKNINDQNIKVIYRICLQWWNYYFNCSLNGNCDYLFTEPKNKNVINYYNTLLLISIMLIYDLSFNAKYFIKLIDYIQKILLINYENYLIICQYLISRIKSEYLDSKWVEKIKEIILSKIPKKNFNISELEYNLQSLNKLLSMIINIFNNNNIILNLKIPFIYRNYQEYDSDLINKIFMKNIVRIENKEGSLLFSLKQFYNPIMTNSYFIINQPTKPLTLVLDLDETIMSFIYKNYDKNDGIIRIRPYLYNFLNLIKEYYEIIIFTASTKIYADSILDAIEIQRGKYFNYRLYREHCSIIDNDYIKDISLIGRDISKVIIVDNMQQNFRLQKNNGILISSFWGEDNNDKALLKLGKILVSIAIDMIDNNFQIDIRDEIKKYKEDILRNVSMN